MDDGNGADSQGVNGDSAAQSLVSRSQDSSFGKYGLVRFQTKRLIINLNCEFNERGIPLAESARDFELPGTGEASPWRDILQGMHILWGLARSSAIPVLTESAPVATLDSESA